MLAAPEPGEGALEVHGGGAGGEPGAQDGTDHLPEPLPKGGRKPPWGGG